MSVEFLGWVLLFAAGIQFFVAFKIFNINKIKNKENQKNFENDVKKFNIFSRVIQVFAIIFVVIFLLRKV